MKNIQAILFDLDGTLINSEICHYKCWNALLESFGPHLEYPHYLKFYSGVSMQTNAQRLIDEFKIEATLTELIERREKLILPFCAPGHPSYSLRSKTVIRAC